jgi:alkaline phosphatase D
MPTFSSMRRLAGLTRRGLLLAAPGLALSGALPAHGAGAQPFSLGVASGDPTPTGVVLWTRLAPDPVQGGGMAPEPVAVEWVIAEDEALRRPVRRGRMMAVPEEAHSVHLEIDGLQPDRWYFYRFTAMGEASPVGRTRTAPAPGSMPRALHIAVGSCQHYEHGFYAAHRQIAASAPDLVAFLGDYIYEASWGRNLLRRHGAPTARTLEDYRNRHALYRSDPDLQAAHAACPWLVTWDDHEVANDYADAIGERERGEPFLARRAAGYQAFWEHMPLPRSAKPEGPNARLYRRAAFGNLASFHILDDRQYRHPQPCQPPDRGGATRVTEEACPELVDPARSLLGTAQEAWLQDGLRRDGARWTLILQQTRMARLGSGQGAPVYWTDGWDGYPAARRRLLETLAVRPAGAGTPLVLGGDIHAFLAAELRPDFDRPETPPVAVELVTTSVTSQSGGRYAVPYARDPHIAFADAGHRGWLSLRLTPDAAQARMQAIADIASAASPVFTLRDYVIEAGSSRLRPG